ncbi:ANTAR domain-containing protein [Streptomyces sp. NPDC001205]
MPHCEPSGSGQVGTCIKLADTPGTHRLSGLTVFSRPEGDRTVVSVCGDLDLTADHALRRALRPGPAGSDGLLRLDVSGVEFCGCSAVNILLHIGEQALAQATLAPDHGDTAPPATDPDPDADLRLELGQLRQAMLSRGTIDLARGILMAAFALTPDDAWRVLVATSQHTNTKLRRLAEQVVDSTTGTPLPESVREHLAAAVTQTGTGTGTGTASD